MLKKALKLLNSLFLVIGGYSEILKIILKAVIFCFKKEIKPQCLWLYWYSLRESNPQLALRSNERAQKSNFLYAKSNIKFVLSNNFIHNFRVVTKNSSRFLTFLMKIIQFRFQIGKSQNKISATLVENRLK